MKEAVASLLVVIGSLFTFLAALGLIRMPDVYMRLQATTKASTLGLGALALGLAVHFSDGGITARALLVLVFVLITAPAGAHAIARAAHRVNIPLSPLTLADELAESRRTQHDGANKF